MGIADGAPHPTREQLEAVLDKLVIVAPPILKRHFTLPVCIATTRIVLDVMRRLGYHAYPFPVRVQVYNRKGAEFIEAGHPEKTKAKVDGAHGIGIGYRPESDRSGVVEIGYGGPPPPGRSTGYNGHLVAIVERDYFVDLSIYQADRPKWDLVAEPFWSPDARDFAKEGERREVKQDKAVLVYEANVGKTDYKHAPDWLERDLARPIAEEILAAMKEAD